MKMKRQRWFWGIFFILGAAILVSTKMHWLTYTAGTFTIIASIVLLAIFIKSILSLTIPGIVFSAAFASMLYAQPLGITALVPWTVLGTALLLSIGLSLIFSPYSWHHRFKSHHNIYHHHANRNHSQWQTDTPQENDPTTVNMTVSMSNSIRYVQSEDLRVLNADIYMGGAKIYLDKAQIKDQATMNLNVELGGLELYMPRDWNVKIQDDVFLSGIEEKGLANTKTGPTVTLQGRLRMAGLTIIYV